MIDSKASTIDAERLRAPRARVAAAARRPPDRSLAPPRLPVLGGGQRDAPLRRGRPSPRSRRRDDRMPQPTRARPRRRPRRRRGPSRAARAPRRGPRSGRRRSARSESGAVANTCAATGASAATMPAASLSASTPSTTPHSSKSNDVAQRRDERPGAVRVVRGIHEHRRADADQLQAAGRGRLRESLGQDVAGDRLRAAADERLDRGDRERGVEALVRAVERQVLVVVDAGEAAHRDQLPADGEALLGEGEVVAFERDGRAAARRPRRAARPRRRHPAAPRRRRRRP